MTATASRGGDAPTGGPVDYEQLALDQLARASIEPIGEGWAEYHLARAPVYATLHLAARLPAGAR